MSELGKQLGLLAAIIIVLALVLTLFGAWPHQQPANPVQSSKTLPAPTPPTQQQLQQLQNSPATFQYLVSYTDKGFQPDTLAVKKGQTVRFTNNSSAQLWVASIGEGAYQIYPGTSSCGASAFDSCQALQAGDFWEFTFTQSGTWDFQNNLDKNETGTVTVK